MTDRHDLFRRMRVALAKCYPQRARAELFAQDIGLSLAQIDLSGAPIEFWQRILEEAERQGKVEALLELASRQAPASRDLADLREEFRQWKETGQPESEPPRTPTVPPTAREEAIAWAEFIRAIGTADISTIKASINNHKTVLNGVPQYLAGDPIIEDVLDFPVSEGLAPDFTRFIFQPQASQIPNYIIFIDFLNPKDSVFLEGTTKSPELDEGEKVVMSYIDFVKNNYDSYCRRAVMLDTFRIPLHTLQGLGGFFGPAYSRGFLQGVLVVGRRKYLTTEQLYYLSESNRSAAMGSGGISIITYDTLVEYSRSKAR